MFRVTPRFGVKMEAEGKVWFDFFVYSPGSRVDLGNAIKQSLSFPRNRVLAIRIVWAGVGWEDVRYTSITKRSFGLKMELGRTCICHWPRGRSNQCHLSSQAPESRRQNLSDAQSQLALGHRKGASYLKPPLLHLGPFATSM